MANEPVEPTHVFRAFQGGSEGGDSIHDITIRANHLQLQHWIGHWVHEIGLIRGIALGRHFGESLTEGERLARIVAACDRAMNEAAAFHPEGAGAYSASL